METKLGAVAAARDAYPSSPSASSSCYDSEKEDLKKKERSKMEFKLHRKNHYNEMEAFKKWKNEHPRGLDDDEEEEDDDMHL